ncbi:RNA polymerase recycling motor HelD [Terrilactibacillus laevilacticus]|uniref:RNA polymerase recycling motor HelD n=1 Tax=Terrilactibacillus laevilacticus TaxID=1380157 RepID=A0ABW5PLW8_9BACI|nr:RNA polymerase recycling motor HelD [Terrilactibacillus laevilacticus]
MENKSLNFERKRLNAILKTIKHKVQKLTGYASGLKEGIVDLRKNFWEDVTVNVDEPDDIVETQASLRQQAELLSERERSHGQIHRGLKTLARLEDSPYFGRIDFIESGEKEAESIYIGIASLMDEKDEEFLIYDWRAPISSMYYDYTPGPASYKAMDGEITGEITLKRQFIIKQSKLEGMFDTGVTIGDALLQHVLGNNTDTQMKSIVATIQKEQNKIIRNTSSKFLIVQGAAGSGKTSAALQRVAFLLYHYRKTLGSENILLFSPNPIFNSYISTVLPELGEENMLQTTLKDYVEDRLDSELRLEDPFSQMEMYLTPEDHTNYETDVEGIRYKATLNFKALIKQYVKSLSTHGLIFDDITFRNRVIISKEDIAVVFYSMDQSIPISNRMAMLTESLLEKVSRIALKERKEDWVLEEGELLDKEDLLNVYKKLQRNKRFTDDTFDDYDREEGMIRKVVIRKHFTPIRKQVKKMTFIDIPAIYRQLFEYSKDASFDHIHLPSRWSSICDETIRQLDDGQCSWADAVPFLYLKDCLLGRKPNMSIKHILIDEAQDYSPFQFDYIKRAFPNCNMTILGDLSQAIYAHTFHEDTLLSNHHYSQDAFEKVTLLKSYRSTENIMAFTRPIIPEGKSIEPFNRQGNKPLVIKVDDSADRYDGILSKMNQLQNEKKETIALICKTMKESRQAYDHLKGKLPIQLMDKETYTFKKGFIIIPVYLAKGIEFDAVIIHDASLEHYHHETERNLFYTACTRAMHNLILFSGGQVTPFIENVPDTVYDMVDYRKEKESK